ncbi:MAG TPA: hypothetical protein VJP60_05440 [Rhizomicrobium sp.]|nr:hypothetical protein [Rhizomicrobium sp.]
MLTICHDEYPASFSTICVLPLALSNRRPALVQMNGGPDQRRKILVPFYATKWPGGGEDLALVRQIATVHDASANISKLEGRSATVSPQFRHPASCRA